MAMRPRPRIPLPPDDPHAPWPPLDPCERYRDQLSYIADCMTYFRDLVYHETGEAFVQERQSLMFSQLSSTLQLFASPWSGIVPPWIPIQCRIVYRAVWRQRNYGYLLDRVVRGECDGYDPGTGKVISDGFVRNRPHDKKLYIKQYIKLMGY